MKIRFLSFSSNWNIAPISVYCIIGKKNEKRRHGKCSWKLMERKKMWPQVIGRFQLLQPFFLVGASTKNKFPTITVAFVWKSALRAAPTREGPALLNKWSGHQQSVFSNLTYNTGPLSVQYSKSQVLVDSENWIKLGTEQIIVHKPTWKRFFRIFFFLWRFFILSLVNAGLLYLPPIRANFSARE